MRVQIIFEYDNEFLVDFIEGIKEIHKINITKNRARALIKEQLYLYGHDFLSDTCIDQMII